MDTTKIIKGIVNGRNYTVTSPIVKEDYGLYLQIEGVELPQTYEVDFSNSEDSGTSVTMIGNSDGVLIPHQFISTGKDVFAFLYHVGEDFGRTVYKFRIPNKVRPDRTNEEPTPEEQSLIDQTISALNDAVEEAQEAQEAIENMSVSATTLAEGSSATVTKTESEGVVHLEFGIPKGQTGDSPTITASKTGNTTYIYADSVEIAQIEDGTNGIDGYSPTANVSKTGKTATITITDKNGTTSAQVEDGTDGISPTVTITPITGGHRITITDADGSHFADVMDGDDYTLTAQDKQDIAELVDMSEIQEDVSDLKEGLSAVESVLEMSESAYTFVDSVEEMTDHTKSYVLRSNNHIYTAQEVRGDPQDEFSLSKVNWRIFYSTGNNNGETANGYLTTDYIPFTSDDIASTITIKNAGTVRDRYDSYTYASSKMVAYDSDKNDIAQLPMNGRVYGTYLPMPKVGSDLVGSIKDNANAEAVINAVANELAYVAFCWPIETATKTEIPDPDLSPITTEQVTERDFGIYISTHGVVTYQFVDTGTVYVQQSAIQRIDTELAEKLDANQGSENVGKVLIIGADGAVEPTDMPEPEADDEYIIALTVGAWGANGKTPTSDGNQLRNAEPIPLAEVRKIKINLPATLSKCSGHAYILDSEQNLIGVTPWGAYIDLNSVASNAVYANISISAFDLNGTAITTIAPYLEDVQSNIVVHSPNSAEAMDSFRNKTHGTVMFSEYIMSEVNAAITALQDVQFAHPNALTLAFMTDLHFGRTAYDTNVNLFDNLACVQMISSECAIGGLMMGGDNIAEASTRANQILNLKQYGRIVRQFGDRVFSTKGNHDDSSISGWDSSASKTKVGYNLFDPEYYLWTERQIENLPNVVFPDDPTGLYYYVDFPAQKVRLIVLNSVDIPYVEDPNNAGYLVYRGQSDYGYSNAQLNWVAHTALDFSDKKDADEWGVVTMQHVQDNPNIPAFSTAVVRNNGAQMYNIFKAFKARTTYSSTSSDTYFPHDVSVDFTNATQELIARISGHTHADRYVLSDDGLHISTMQAGPNSVGNSPASDGVTYTKTVGTGEESAVDFFTFDRIGKKVYCTRYGAGLSRELSWV